MLEKKLLIASGIENEREIQDYVDKIGALVNQFGEYKDKFSTKVKRKLTSHSSNYLLAKELFNFLNSQKPRRYNSSTELSEVIDRQMSPDRNHRVGNCAGLTSLFTVLGNRLDLDLSIGLIQHGDNGELHVRSILDNNGREIQIENTSKRGFDYPRLKYDDKCSAETLVPITYNLRATRQMEKGNLGEAVPLLTRAVQEYPEFDISYLNLGSLLCKIPLPAPDKAIPLFKKAIQLRKSEEAHFGLASAYGMVGQTQLALDNFGEVLQINRKHLETYVNMGSMLQQLGFKDDALKCFINAKHLNKNPAYTQLIEEGLRICSK